MKQLNMVKLFFVALLCAAGVANAQPVFIKPLAFAPHALAGSTSLSGSNFYKDYVGLRFEVSSPTVIGGDKLYTTANDGSGGTGMWGGTVTTPLINVPIIMDSTADSFGCSTFSITMTGKIAVVWRGPISTPCDFACKALHAQMAGAVAVVLINEYPGQPPIGMGAGTTCTGITIPVFMISNLDGIAISGQYRAGVPVKITITPWGAGNTNDLGIIPGGGATWHAYAYPKNQLSSNESLAMLDGAYVANFGTAAASNVKLSAYLNFTPTGGSASLVHADSATFSAAAPPLAPNYPFAAADSILAIFPGTEYSLSATSNGRYDLTYQVSTSSFTDDNPSDNTYTTSFYITDNLYSKGRYDFTNNQPVRGTAIEFGTAGSEFLWGNMYFVGPTAGTGIDNIQYSLAQNSGSSTPGTIVLSTANGGNTVMIFKWVDGANGQPMDSLLQDGELTLVSSSFYSFDNINDTSDALLQLKRHNPLGRNAIGNATGDTSGTVLLDANSWYYVAVDVPPSSATTPFFLGVDNVLSPLPRIVGRAHTSGLLDYNTFVSDPALATPANPANPEFPCASAEVSFVNAVDSFNFHGVKGLIPAISMIVNNAPDTTHSTSHVGVNTVVASTNSLNIYPNPASENLNIAVNFAQPAKVVTYEIIDGLARFVKSETHYNVQNEVYSMPVNTLPSGHYFLNVIANGAVQTRQFTVIR